MMPNPLQPGPLPGMLNPLNPGFVGHMVNPVSPLNPRNTLNPSFLGHDMFAKKWCSSCGLTVSINHGCLGRW